MNYETKFESQFESLGNIFGYSVINERTKPHWISWEKTVFLQVPNRDRYPPCVRIELPGRSV